MEKTDNMPISSRRKIKTEMGGVTCPHSSSPWHNETLRSPEPNLSMTTQLIERNGGFQSWSAWLQNPNPFLCVQLFANNVSPSIELRQGEGREHLGEEVKFGFSDRAEWTLILLDVIVWLLSYSVEPQEVVVKVWHPDMQVSWGVWQSIGIAAWEKAGWSQPMVSLEPHTCS